MNASVPDREVPFQGLTPDVVLNAVESCGFMCDGTLLALNSYENRVYQVGIESEQPVVTKFYRPHRWSNEAILEEHAFSFELQEHDVPVVAPWRNAEGRSLHSHEGFRFAIFPRQGGRAPELDRIENIQWLGRFIGRIHAVGGVKAFRHRPTLSIEEFGERPSQFLLEQRFVPPDLEASYREVAQQLLAQIRDAYASTGPIRHIRLHGDCHPGNILWTDAGPHFVDLDDCRMGPAVQDLWMVLSGNREEMSMQLMAFLDGYRTFYDFDPRELHLVEALRSLRMINYAAWLARRWNDPAFPKSFSWFNTYHYWQDHIGSLREQTLLVAEPPLEAWR